MTIYATHYILDGLEIQEYRKALKTWAALSKGELLHRIEDMIRRTYGPDGQDAEQVDEYMQCDEIQPLLHILNVEIDGARVADIENDRLPIGERDRHLGIRLDTLLQLGLKLRSTEISSTFSPMMRR